MKGGPIQFLVLVAALWGVARSTIVWTTPAQMRDDLRSLFTWADPPARASVTAPPASIETKVRPPGLRPPARVVPVAMAAKITVEPARIQTAALRERTAFAVPVLPAPVRPALPTVISAPLAATPFADRVSVSSWVIARGAGGPSLAGGGLLGGSQAGVRATAALSPGLAIAGRVSAPLSTRGAEAALGLDWRPVRTLPVTITAERRVRIDRGGRNAFAVGLFGGVDAVPLPAGTRLDGYAQAGVVGLSRRDAYVDGAVRIERPVADIGSIKLAVGGGAWGAAQPGAARIDLGPQLVARIPAGSANLRLGLDWRQRIAGDARPGSGPALSIGTDF